MQNRLPQDRMVTRTQKGEQRHGQCLSPWSFAETQLHGVDQLRVWQEVKKLENLLAKREDFPEKMGLELSLEG